MKEEDVEGTSGTYGQTQNLFGILPGKPKRKKPTLVATPRVDGRITLK
jgi:hypothetical protein